MYLSENAIDVVCLYKFLRLLTLPFREWEAYKLGVIDAEGLVILKPQFRNSRQRESFNRFEVLVRNLKRILEKIPGGKSRIASYAAGLYLIREEKNAHMYQDEDITYESYMDFYELLLMNENFVEQSRYLIEQAEVSGALPEEDENLVDEDAPANSVSGNGVAGLTVATGGPVIRQKSKKKKKLESFKNKIAS